MVRALNYDIRNSKTIRDDEMCLSVFELTNRPTSYLVKHTDQPSGKNVDNKNANGD